MSARPILDQYANIIPSRGSIELAFQCKGAPCSGTDASAEAARIFLNWNPIDASGRRVVC